MVTIVSTAMSLIEARWCVTEIKQGIISVRERIWELYTREGWQALGYRTWQECKEREFGTSSRHIERLLAAARVERNLPLDTTNWSHQIPESHLRPLTSLEPDQQREVWLQIIDENSSNITGAKVQEMVDRVTSVDDSNGNGDSDEFREYEHEMLLPRLHDAGLQDAPQILSGQVDSFQPVSEQRQEQTEESLRQAIIEQLSLCRQGHSVDECTDEILDILGQSSSSIALAARFGIALVQGPQTLADLTAMAIEICGDADSARNMPRDDYLRWRKRVLRLVDSLTYSGCGIFEHTLANGQICYALTKEL